MRENILIMMFLLFGTSCFGQSYNLSINCQTDTNFNIHLGGLLDGSNYQQPKLYIVGGRPDYKHLAVREPLDSFVVTNNGLTDLNSFTFICGDNNIYQIDGLAQYASAGPSSSTDVSIYKLYRYHADHQFYFFDPEIDSRETKDVTRLQAIYGYGYHGSITNSTTLLGKKIFGAGQRFWMINQGNHSLSEIFANGKYYFMDANEEMLVKGRNNSNYISLGEAYEDLFLFYRTKVYGSTNFYNFNQSNDYASPRFFDQVNHSFSASIPKNTSSCSTKDTVGNYGPDLYYDLKSGESLILSRKKDTLFNYHHYPLNYCTNTANGYLPEQNTAFPAMQNLKLQYDLFTTNQPEADKFDTKSNTTFSYANHTVMPTSLSSAFFTVKRISQFPAVGGQLKVGGTFQDNTDSLGIYISFDGSNWIWMKTLTQSTPQAVLSLDQFIHPHTDLAHYTLYFKVKFNATGSVSDAVLHTFQWDLRYQISRFLYPTLYLGDNNVALKMSGNLQPGQINCKIFWTENSENIPPTPPQFALYPANGSTVNKTDIRFRWEQLDSDWEGDSIWEWQFQLSEYPDFRTVVANNFDHYSMLSEGYNAYFYNYFDTLYGRNTFFNHNTTYYWRVRVRDIRNAWSNWSDTWSFTVLAPKAVRNTHFELVLGNKNQLKLKWKKGANDNLATNYRLLVSDHPANLYFHPNQVINYYTGNTELLYNVDSSQTAFRVFAMDNDSNCSPPAPIVTIPEFKKHKVYDTLNLASTVEALQHPFPNYPSLQRNYFILFDTAYFESVTATSFHSKRRGRTLINICYIDNDDTIYKKQLLIQIQDFANLNAICSGNGKYVTIDAPMSPPLLVNYVLNGTSFSKTLTTATDSIFLSYGDSLFVQKISNSTDTIVINQKLVNNTQALAMAYSDLPFNCTTVQAEMSMIVSGMKPFILTYTQNGDTLNKLLTTGNNTLSFDNGVYHLVELKDSFLCSLPFSIHQQYNYDTLQFSADSLITNCDSLRIEMPIHLEGNGPWKIFYTKQGGPIDSVIKYQHSDTIRLASNIYFFNYVKDATGCILNLSFTKNMVYTPITIQMDTVAVNCIANHQAIMIHSTGMYPLKLFHSLNGVGDSILITTANYNYVMSNGLHHFSYVKDAKGCIKNVNASYTINHQTLDYSMTQPYYDCDSHKTYLQVNVQGNPPYKVYYRRDGSNYVMSSTGHQFNFWLDGTHYYIDSVRGGSCVKAITGPNHYFYPYQYPQLSISNVQMSCIDDSMYVNYTLNGGILPIQLTGTYNGSPFTKTLYTPTGKINLNIGTYFFSSFSDTTACYHPLNISLNANSEKLTAQIGEALFQCSTASFPAHVILTGNPPFTLYYRKNGVDSVLQVTNKVFDLLLGNGNYLFDSVKDASCTIPIVTPYTYQFNSGAFTTSVQPVQYNCSNGSSSTFIQTIGGLPPYTLLYTFNGVPDSVTYNIAGLQWTLNNGTYVLQQVHDAHYCINTLNTPLTVNFTPLQYQLSSPVYICDSAKSKFTLSLQGTPPYTLYYRKNGTPNFLSSSSGLITFYLPNGFYQFDSIKDSHCTSLLGGAYTYTFNFAALGATFSDLKYSCSNGQVYKDVNLTGGTAPYKILYLKNGSPDSVTLNAATSSWILSNGTYQVLSMKDVGQCAVSLSHNFSVNYTPLNVTIGTPAYLCDSGKTKLNIALQGNPPYTVYLRKNGVDSSIITSSSSITLYLPNGIYVFDSVKDDHCTKPFTSGNGFAFNYSAINTSFGNLQYNCATQQAFVPVQISNGVPPYTIHYTLNGVPSVYQTSSTSFQWILTNGQYQVSSITDMNQCPLALSLTYNVNYQNLSCVIANPVLLCDSGKAKINFSLQGNPPFRIYYRSNAVNQVYITSLTNPFLMFANGSHSIDSIRDQKCTFIPSQPITYTFNYQPLTAQLVSIPYQCGSTLQQVQVNVSGNAPYQLQYLFNGGAQTKYFNSSNYLISLQNGTYNFLSVTDTAGCSVSLNQNMVVNTTPLNWTIQSPQFDCDSNKSKLNFQFTGVSPWKIYYRKNNVATVVVTNNANFNLYLGNGNYTFDSIGDFRCARAVTSSNQYSFNYQPLTFSHTTPAFDCDSAKMKMTVTLSGNAPYTIYTSWNGVNDSILLTGNTANLYFGNGNAVIQKIKDANQCIKTINESFNFTQTPLTVTSSLPAYNCSTNLFNVTFSLTGSAPFTVYYTKNGNSGSSVSSTSTLNLSMNEGTWVITKVTDNRGCTVWLNQPYVIPHTRLLSHQVIQNQYSCSLNKHVTKLSFQGNPPYWLYYHQTAPISNSLVLSFTSDSSTLYFDQGQYVIDSVKDNYNCVHPINLSITHNQDPIAYTMLSNYYDCDSAMQKVTLQFTGIGPWTLQYKNTFTGFVYTMLYTQATPTLYFPTGEYEILSLSDQNCTVSVHDTIHNLITPFQATLSGSMYSCFEKKFYVVADCSHGLPPYTLHYTKNGLNYSFTLNGFHDTLLLDLNGNFWFDKITDSFGCEKILNTTVNTNGSEPIWHTVTTSYDCSRDSTLVVFHVTDSVGVKLVFNSNITGNHILSLDQASQIYLPNGQYHWLQLITNPGCILPIDEYTTIDEYPNNFNIDSIVKNCPSSTYRYYLSGSGKFPITLHYLANGIPSQSSFFSSPGEKEVPAGTYVFQKTVDAHGCELSITRTDTLKPFTPADLRPEMIDQWISVPDSNRLYSWYKDDSLLVTNGSHQIPYAGNGTYYAQFIDTAGCIRSSLELVVSLPLKASIYPNPVTNLLSIRFNDDIDFWEYEIRDITGHKIAEGVVSGSTGNFNVEPLAIGFYHILIRAKTLEQVYRFMKQ